MKFIHALDLINLAIKNHLLEEKDDNILVYRNATLHNNEGWYLADIHTVAKELMDDEKGQQVIINALKEKNVEFIPKEY